MYKAVLIGLGNISWKFDSEAGVSLSHLSSFFNNNQVDLVAGCDPQKSERELFKSKHNIKTYLNYKTMIYEEKPDIVSICSPTKYHYEHLEFCIKNDIKMVWLEKPAVESCSQLDNLIRLNKTTKVVVNYQRRYTSTYQKFKEVLDNLEYGKPKIVEVRYSRDLLTNGSHMIDMIFYILSISKYELLWVENDIKTSSPSFVIRDKRGFLIIVSGSELPFHNIDFTITFNNKRVSILHNDIDSKIEDMVEHEMYPDFYRLIDSKSNFFDSIMNKNCAFDSALKDLINSYELTIEPKSSLSTAYKTHELIDKILNFNL